MSDMASGSPAERITDPTAVAAGNASLLGIGYLLIGERGLALGTGLFTVALLAVLAASGSGALQVIVVLWWVALIGHGWWSGRRTPVRHARARWIGLVSAIVVLLAVVSLRSNAAFTAASLDGARADGDCQAAAAAQQRSWFGSRLADAPAASDADDTLQACRQLVGVRERLDAALAPNVGELGAAYRDVRVVLTTLPGHERMVDVTLNDFVARLPESSGCAAAQIVDWIGAQPVQDDPLRRLADTAAELAPQASVDCGDMLRAMADFAGATDRYQQVLTQFPGTPQTEQAQVGLSAAAAGQRAADARQRLPSYCDAPFAYPEAPALGPGINRAAFVPNALSDSFIDWKTDDISQTALVVCLDSQQRGSAARVCSYIFGLADTTDVTFYRAAFPIRVYELRTGQIVLDARPEIGDPSCPDELSYETYGYFSDAGPPDHDTEVSSPDQIALWRQVLAPVIVR